MTSQNYQNHRRMVPGFHYLGFGLILLVLIGSLVNVYRSVHEHGNLYSATLIVVMAILFVLAFWYSRTFALKAQDRAIRAEESLRYFIITGKPIDSRLKTGQIIALRFASDEELVSLAKKAIDENLKPDDIKKLIRQWKADYHRV